MKNGVVAFVLDVVIFISTLIEGVLIAFPTAVMLRSALYGNSNAALFIILFLISAAFVLPISCILNIVLSGVVIRRAIRPLCIIAHVIRVIAIAIFAFLALSFIASVIILVI